MLDSESVMLNKKRAMFALSTGNIVPQDEIICVLHDALFIGAVS